MKTTLILEARPEAAEFLNQQANTSDPSLLINQLLRAAKNREGLGKQASDTRTKSSDELQNTLEDFLDQNTAAGD